MLNDSNIIIDTQLLYSPTHQFFEAFYWLPNHNIDYYRLYIRTGSVVSSSAKHAKTFLETEVIPEFILWLKELISLPDNSPKLNNELCFFKSYVI